MKRTINAAKRFYQIEDNSSCGVGLIVDLSINKSHKVIEDAALLLSNLKHRAAIGADPLLGDGSGFTFAIPDLFLRKTYPHFLFLFMQLIPLLEKNY